MTTMLPDRQLRVGNQENGATGIKLVNGHLAAVPHLWDAVDNQPAGDHPMFDNQASPVSDIKLGIDQFVLDHHIRDVDVTNFASGQVQSELQASSAAGEPNPKLISHYGSVLDLWEGFRKSINNQVRAFVRFHDTAADDPSILAAIMFQDSIKRHEAGITKLLEKSVAMHPLGPWIKGTHGLGYKAVGRVLAAAGDPYADGPLGQPRTAAQFRQYCGFGDPDQRRRKNERGNWNPRARMAVWNVADPMIKNRGLWRPVYDEARERYAETVHGESCVRCGPKGRPAEAGSPLSKGHQHARGIRAVCKAFLNELHREAVRLHEVNGTSLQANECS